MTAVVPLGGLTLTRRIGAGGEADVFEVAERPGLVCKRYRVPTPERAAKLRVMVASPPSGTSAGGHVSIAWPTELVTGAHDEVTGFLMPRIDVRAAVPVFQVYNPASRLQVAPGFTWRYLLRTARNVAAIVDSLHRAGYVVGDLNESNLLVDRRALVSLVDCDSMQVADPVTGAVHHSPVGKPEFLAPELHGRALATTERTPATDVFALTILISLLLSEGVHPYAGVWRGRGDPPDVATRIRKGWSAGRRRSPVDPPPHAVPASALPADVRRMVRRGLSSRPARRPAAWEWVATLEAMDARLRVCARSEHHVVARRAAWLGRCPWCARIDRGLPDPFPGPTGASTLTRRPPPWWRRAGVLVRSWIARVAPRLRGPAVPVGASACAGAGAWLWPLVVVPFVVLVAVPLVGAWRDPDGGVPVREHRRLSPLRPAFAVGRFVRRFAEGVRTSAIATLVTAPVALALVATVVGLDDWALAARAAAALTAAAHSFCARARPDGGGGRARNPRKGWWRPVARRR